jgi:hypothetical protein
MVREPLQSASDHLRRASEAASGELQRRLYDQSDQIASLATRERGPDHGRLDRHMNTLREISGELDGEAADHVAAALEDLREYREGVEGV